MKLKDIKRALIVIDGKCPSQYGLKRKFDCDNYVTCFECWNETLHLEENKEAIEREDV